MAIFKAINKSTTSHRAMKNCIAYVLKDMKIKDGFVYLTGPAPEQINSNTIYNSFLEEKKLWDKDCGRMYSHNVISFHKDEVITPEQLLEFGKEFAYRWFPNNQSLITIHQDREHLHIHIVTNTVSFIDGRKLHNSKADLQKMKDLTNKMCRDRGLTVPKKGKHFNGTSIGEGDVISWDKNQYYMLNNKINDSFLFNCYVAVLTSIKNSGDKDGFIANMKMLGWNVNWKDNRKNIVFINENGKKIRDSRLAKTFNINNISKEGIINELKKNSREQQERSRENNQDGATIKEEYSNRLYEYQKEFDEWERELESYYRKCEDSIRGGKDNRQAEEDNIATERGIRELERENRGNIERARNRKKKTRKSNDRNTEIER